MEQLHLGNVPPLDTENDTSESSSAMNYLLSVSANETLTHYRKFMIDMIEAFLLVTHNKADNVQPNWVRQSRKRVEKDVDDMLAFEVKLVNVSCWWR